jgi:hypothetical protein
LSAAYGAAVAQDRAQPRVTLVSRPGCHLCDEARAVVAGVAADVGVEWEERSLLDDPDLTARYAEMVPVVLVDGRQHDYWRVDEQRLRAALTRGGSWLSRWLR